MILESIELKNIRSYDEQKIEFPRGITLFEGDIGSGKSTILMAIEFAFFGTGSQKGDSMLSKKVKNGSVKLRFEVDGEKYEVYRELKRTTKAVNQHPTHCYLKIGEVENPFSPGELKQEILKILKFNEPASPNAQSKIYRYAVFTPQEEMKQILYDSDKRQETIRRAFGVEDYKNARQNAKKVSKTIENKSIRYQERGKDVPDLEIKLKELEDSMEKNKDIEKENRDKRTNKESEKVKIKKEIEEIGNKSQQKERFEKDKQTKEELLENLEIEDLRKEIEDKKKKIEERKVEIVEIGGKKRPTEINKEAIEKKIDEIRDIEKTRSELHHSKDEINENKKRIDELRKEIEERKVEIVEIGGKKRPTEINKEAIEKKIDEIKKIESNRSTLLHNKSAYSQGISKLKKLGTKCLFCHQNITKEHSEKLVEEQNNALAKINSLLQDSDENIKNILNDVEIDSVENAVDKLLELKQDLIEYERSSDRLSELTNEQEEDKKELSEKEKNKTEKEKREFELNKQIDELQEKIDDFPDYEYEKEEKKKKLDDIDHELDEIKETLGIIKGQNENLKKQKDDLEVSIQKSIHWKKKHKELEDYQTWIEQFFIPTTDEIERQVLNSIRHDFNETYRNWFKILIDDSSKDSRLDEDFTPILEQDGEWQDFNYVSGGEKTSIALAYRLSLNNMMRRNSESLKSNLLILDEPTDGFSKNHLSKVRDVLKELGSEQIILVSHERELEGYVDNIFQISKEKGYSKVERLD
jgi:exonuclease SbcC